MPRGRFGHGRVIDHVRYLFAAANMVVLPIGLLFWLVIHSFAPRWRKLGPGRTYLTVLPIVALCGVLLYSIRRILVGADLGTHASLIVIGLVLWAISTIEIRYWRHLSIRTLVGITELSSVEGGADKLLTEGAYRTVRHPRYLSAGIGVIGNVFIANYAGVYVLLLILFPLGFIMLMLEERELVDRFGERYRQYQREVPRIIPRFRKR